MAMRCKHFPQRGTDLAAAPVVAVSMSVIMAVAFAVLLSVLCGVRLGVVGHALRPFALAGFASAILVSCRVASSAASR